MLLWLSVANATIVNVLTPSIGPLDEGWKGSVKAGGTVHAGNEKRTGANLAAGLTYKKENHLSRFHASLDVGRAFGEVTSQKAFVNARHLWQVHEGVAPFGFVQVDHNPFRGLAVRDLFGAGVDLRMGRSKHAEAHLGLSVMGEHQVHNEGFVDDDSGLHARFSTYATVAVKTEGILLASTTFFQPRVDQPANFRILQELSMTLDVNTYLDWNVLLRLEQDSRPPNDIEPFDLALRSGIVVGF